MFTFFILVMCSVSRPSIAWLYFMLLSLRRSDFAVLLSRCSQTGGFPDLVNLYEILWMHAVVIGRSGGCFS